MQTAPVARPEAAQTHWEKLGPPLTRKQTEDAAGAAASSAGDSAMAGGATVLAAVESEEPLLDRPRVNYKLQPTRQREVNKT